MILCFELEDWSILKKIFMNINEIIDEIIILCDDEGLKFSGIDRSHICFFEGFLSKDLFDEYVLENVLSVYVDLNDFVNILKRGNSKDKLIFEADDERLTVKFKNKNLRTFSITQIDGVLDSKTPPKLDYSVNFECDFEVIKNSLKDVDLYSDRLKFKCEGDLLCLSGEGSFGEYKNEYSLNDSVDGSYSSSYTVDWLLKIFNNKLGSDVLKISMGNDFPMLIEMELENIVMNYLLAPRIEN